MSDNDTDQHYMTVALQEAQSALNAGDYPVGAALVVDGELWGTGRNRLFSEDRTTAHAEHNVFDELSGRLRRSRMSDQRIYTATLYTTLEPCLMCLGTAVMHYVSRIVFACPDPNGGAASLDYTSLGSVYQSRWPAIEFGPHRDQSCDLIIAFLKLEKFPAWSTMLAEFREMKQSW